MWFLKLTIYPLKVKVTKDSMIVFLYKGKIALYDLAELLVLNVKVL